MSESFSQNLLGGLRFAVGLLSLTPPGLAARAFGIDSDVSSG